MCGIAGTLGAGGAPARRLLEPIAHRGPDGWDVWRDDGVELGHRRLAIVAVASGKQPMTSTDGRFTIVYNGEVYNHRPLREQLAAKGARFATDSDTEVLLEAWKAWGPAGLARLDGMFAFALWDRDRRTLTLARDRWGVKPLHLCTHGGVLRFGSELKALLADPGVPRTLDLDRVRERAILEYIPSQPAPASPFAHIHPLPPGTYVTYAAPSPGNSLAQASPKPYAALALAAKAGTPEQMARALAEALAASVEAQRMGERPVSTVLSGGLDSALVAHAQKRAGHDVTAFTVVGGDDVPDVVAARSLADAAGHDLREVPVDAAAVARDLPRLLGAHEGFHYTEAFFLPLFAAVAGHGPVSLCGQGSDELWGGYARYRHTGQALDQHLARLRASGHTGLAALEPRLRAAHRDGATLAKWDQAGQLADFQLRLADGTSMASGVEARVPFLSLTLQALSDACAWNRKVHADTEKWILRKAADLLGLPKEAAWRPKLPAGRATLPGPIAALETEAARHIRQQQLAAGPLGGTFTRPMELAAYRLWHEAFVVRGGDASRLRLEDAWELAGEAARERPPAGSGGAGREAP